MKGPSKAASEDVPQLFSLAAANGTARVPFVAARASLALRATGNARSAGSVLRSTTRHPVATASRRSRCGAGAWVQASGRASPLFLSDVAPGSCGPRFTDSEGKRPVTVASIIVQKARRFAPSSAFVVKLRISLFLFHKGSAAMVLPRVPEHRRNVITIELSLGDVQHSGASDEYVGRVLIKGCHRWFECFGAVEREQAFTHGVAPSCRRTCFGLPLQERMRLALREPLYPEEAVLYGKLLPIATPLIWLDSASPARFGLRRPLRVSANNHGQRRGDEKCSVSHGANRVPQTVGREQARLAHVRTDSVRGSQVRPALVRVNVVELSQGTSTQKASMNTALFCPFDAEGNRGSHRGSDAEAQKR